MYRHLKSSDLKSGVWQNCHIRPPPRIMLYMLSDPDGLCEQLTEWFPKHHVYRLGIRHTKKGSIALPEKKKKVLGPPLSSSGSNLFY